MTRERVPALDGWRGVAILLVLAGHCQYALFGNDPLNLGSHGVILFFVLSGYLITGRLLVDKAQDTINLKKFYMRRVRRLLPAAWMYLAVAAAILLFSGTPIHRLEFISAILCFRNYVDSHSLTGHFWSLSVEEQFYVIWPFLLTRLRKSTLITSVLGVCALVSAGRAFGWVLLPHAGWSNFHTEHCADALLIGCLAALVENRLASYLTGIPLWPFFTIYILQLLRNPLPAAGEFTLVAMMLLISCRKQVLISCLPLRSCGLISYSLYLWQEPFLMGGTHVSSAAGLILRLFALTVVAALSWYLLEPNPFRNTVLGSSVSLPALRLARARTTHLTL